MATLNPVRLCKQLSSVLRLCSRKEADEWIQAGRVLVNGEPAQVGSRVHTGDTIVVQGDGNVPGSHTRRYRVVSESDRPSQQPLFPRIFIANKRSGQICDRTKDDNFFQTLESRGGGNFPRGLLLACGLDVMASGLLLLTDNSQLKTLLEKQQMNQVFYLKCASKGPPDHVALRWLKSGPRIGKQRFPSISATVLASKFVPTDQAYRTEISVAFKEGRFRDLKKVLGSIGLTVTVAERRKYGPFLLDRIGEGHIAELTPHVVEASLDKAAVDWRSQFLPASLVHVDKKKTKISSSDSSALSVTSNSTIVDV